MTGNELLKSMLCTTQTPDQTAAIACSKAGISSHGGLLCRSGSDRSAGMRTEKNERLSNQPV